MPTTQFPALCGGGGVGLLCSVASGDGNLCAYTGLSWEQHKLNERRLLSSNWGVRTVCAEIRRLLACPLLDMGGVIWLSPKQASDLIGDMESSVDPEADDGSALLRLECSRRRGFSGRLSRRCFWESGSPDSALASSAWVGWDFPVPRLLAFEKTTLG